jgi:hypothetical protein
MKILSSRIAAGVAFALLCVVFAFVFWGVTHYIIYDSPAHANLFFTRRFDRISVGMSQQAVIRKLGEPDAEEYIAPDGSYLRSRDDTLSCTMNFVYWSLLAPRKGTYRVWFDLEGKMVKKDRSPSS